jgi:methylated-DNA-[protein]-cysteine S-methyltransferase
MIEVGQVDSPIGPLTLAVRGARLCLLHFGADEEGAVAALRRWYPGQPIASRGALAAAARGLASYFAGETTALDGIAVEMNGTPFQRRVWEALRDVRVGTTASYGEIARRIGSPSAVRAVGAANGANPIAIVVPCHRIIGGSGSLTGYGGGLERKRWLLRHEHPEPGTLQFEA